MSYPGRFSRLCIGDGGTQSMAKGEDNTGSRVDEGLPLTFFEDFPLCVNVVGVITWLRHDGESRQMHFGRNFPFLLKSKFPFLPRDLILRHVRRKTEGE